MEIVLPQRVLSYFPTYYIIELRSVLDHLNHCTANLTHFTVVITDTSLLTLAVYFGNYVRN